MNARVLTHTASVLASSAKTGMAPAQPASQSHEGTDALLFKDDAEFWYEIERLFGAAEYGAALFGEVIAPAIAGRYGVRFV